MEAFSYQLTAISQTAPLGWRSAESVEEEIKIPPGWLAQSAES
jgi:hypothetical protein